MQDRQLAIVQLLHKVVPLEVVPLGQTVQVPLSNPKSSGQAVQFWSEAPLQVRQALLHAVQRKVEGSVNEVELQASHLLLLSPNPDAHWLQSPLVASQTVQLVHVRQVPVPSMLKVAVGQASQTVPLT